MATPSQTSGLIFKKSNINSPTWAIERFSGLVVTSSDLDPMMTRRNISDIIVSHHAIPQVNCSTSVLPNGLLNYGRKSWQISPEEEWSRSRVRVCLDAGRDNLCPMMTNCGISDIIIFFIIIVFPALHGHLVLTKSLKLPALLLSVRFLENSLIPIYTFLFSIFCNSWSAQCRNYDSIAQCG